MTWRSVIRHVSGYRYQAPVRSSYNEARITPLTTTSQTTIESRVEVEPAARPYRYWDYWGTLVQAFDIQVPHVELIVTGTSIVETNEALVSNPSISWRDLGESRDALVEYLVPTSYVPDSTRFAAGGAAVRSADGPVATAHLAAEWVRSVMTYQAGATVVSTSGADALAKGEGVCQDFVHVFLGAVRSLGIPARYVSGYLHPLIEPEVGHLVHGQSHAWAEVWAGQWVPLDPTNGATPGRRHVVVGRGRDYLDVAPLRGIYSGGAAHALDVEVELTRII